MTESAESEKASDSVYIAKAAQIAREAREAAAHFAPAAAVAVLASVFVWRIKSVP